MEKMGDKEKDVKSPSEAVDVKSPSEGVIEDEYGH